jgi:hypothetical protein
MDGGPRKNRRWWKAGDGGRRWATDEKDGTADVKDDGRFRRAS